MRTTHLALGAVLVVLGSAAVAQSVVYGTNGGSYVIQDADLAAKINAKNGLDRILSQVPEGNVTFEEKVRPTIGSKQVEMGAKRSIPWASVAGTAARAAGWAGVAVSAYQLWDSVRAKPQGGGISYDEGAPQETVTLYKCGSNNEPQYQRTGPSASTACNSYAVDHFERTNTDDATWDRSTSINSVACNTAQCNIQATLTATRRSDGFTSTLAQGIVVPFYTTTGQQCPASVDALNPANSIPAGLAPQADGRCKTGRYNTTLSQAELATRLADYGDKSKAADTIAEAAANNDVTPSAWSPTSLGGPSAVQQPAVTTTTTTPSGTSTTTTQVTNNITYSGNSYSYDSQTTTVTGDTTVVTNAPAAEVETCGLPGKPACRIDETGTPGVPADTAQQDADGAFAGSRAAVEDAEGTFGAFPEISWTFELPSACGPIPLPAFEPFLTEIDVCQFQPIFHDIMAVVWVLGGLFGAIGLFWRDQLQAA